MGMTPNERYHACLESLGVPHRHNRRNQLHPLHFVSRDLERIVAFARLNQRVDKPLKMLLTYWRLYNAATEKFDASQGQTREQEANYSYYVTNAHDMVMLFIIKRMGGVGDALRALDKLPLADIDGSLATELERITTLPLKVVR